MRRLSSTSTGMQWNGMKGGGQTTCKAWPPTSTGRSGEFPSKLRDSVREYSASLLLLQPSTSPIEACSRQRLSTRVKQRRKPPRLRLHLLYAPRAALSILRHLPPILTPPPRSLDGGFDGGRSSMRVPDLRDGRVPDKIGFEVALARF